MIEYPELTSTSVLCAIEGAIRKWIPTVTILRQGETSGYSEETLPLNVFRTRGGQDTVTGLFHVDGEQVPGDIFPYVFITQLGRTTTGRTRIGEAIRYDYNYLISIDYYIDIAPHSLGKVSFLQEELDKMELMLERVLQEIEIFGLGDIYPTSLQSSHISEAGVLLTTRTVEVSEDTIPPVHDKIEALDTDMSLDLDVIDK